MLKLSKIPLLWLGSRATVWLDKAAAVKGYCDSMPKGTAFVVKYFTPWCGHCKSLAPSFEIAQAAIGQWDRDQVHGTEFGEMDCELYPSECKKLGVSGFPTIKFYDDKANGYMDYPRLPRTPECLTAYFAQYRRKIQPYSDDMKSVFLTRTCPSTLKYGDSVCRAFRTENYLEGSAQTFGSFNARFKNAPKVMLEFLSVDETANESICIFDRYTHEKRFCVDHFDADSAQSVEAMRQGIRRHRHPYVIPDATWYDFFNLRLAQADKRLVTLASRSIAPEDLAALAKKFVDAYIFMTVTEGTSAVFEQAGRSMDNAVLVFETSKYDKGFYYFQNPHAETLSAEALEDWLNSVLKKRVKKEYPPGHRTAVEELTHTVSTFRAFLIGSVKSLSLRRKAQVVLTAIGLAAAWVYMVLPDEHAPAVEPLAAKGAENTAFSAVQELRGVCIVNGKVVVLVKQALPAQNE